MHLIKKLLSAVIPLSIALSMPAMAREWAEIKSSGTLIAATEGAFAPFNYYEGKKLTGYEVDVAEAIAKKMGLKLEWRVVPFDAQLFGTAANNGQMVFDVAPESKVSVAIDQLASMLSGREKQTEKPSVLKKLLGR